MGRLLMRSMLVLALLFGLVFAVGIAVLYHYQVPVGWALGLAIGVVTLQYLISPYLIDRIYRIIWVAPHDVSPAFADFLTTLCHRRGIPVPRIGVIEDGNPNAFTYGHVPGNARVVITRGLQQMLSEEELHAVVAHEIGHIRHYDFIVMTFASLVPLLLYILYTWTRGRRGNEGGAAAAVGIGAYLAYLVSQYIVLLLSRVREYFADQHAAESVPEANAISTALIKIAYGLARLPQESMVEEKGRLRRAPVSLNRALMAGGLGICSFNSASTLALYAADAGGTFSTEKMLGAMQWDLWNPWARFFEFQSTHPLVARRVQAVSAMVQQLGQTPAFPVRPQGAQNLWPAFRVDLFFAALPWLGLLLGLWGGLAASGYHLSALLGDLPASLLQIGFAPLLAGIGWIGRLMFTYRNGAARASVANLLEELEVSHIRGIPVVLHGQIIGRGVPGLFWSKDLVLQDDTGFITVIYRQPLALLETLFGLLRADRLVGKKGLVRGWYRRGPSPYLELRSAAFEGGDQLRCYYATVLWVGAILLTVLGAVLVVLGLAGAM